MTLDLSAITDSLIGLVKTAWPTAPIWGEVVGGTNPTPTFTPNFTGLAPDAAREQPGPQLSLYLYHVESNTAVETLMWAPQFVSASPGPASRFLPMALDAFYLLFAYSESSYIEEQEAMSVAMRVFHQQPIVHSDPGSSLVWELTLTPEHRSYDELSRLWQATTVPLRMSLVYRAAVALLDGDAGPGTATNPKELTIAVGQLDVPAVQAGTPALTSSMRTVTYAGPAGEPVVYAQSPATVAPGQLLYLVGSQLGPATTGSVYLLDAAGNETDVSAWADVTSSTASRTAVRLPATVGTAPAASPPPGLYQFRLGQGALGSAGAYRTNATPVGVAALVKPAAGPILAGSAPYTVTGDGFTSAGCEVLVGSVALAPVTGVPAAGEVAIADSGTALSFDPPDGPAGAVVPVRVRVAGVESDPALWVTL